jgi:hypothetical protein
MLYNEFIEKMLVLMSYPIPRLRNAQERLAIQIELQNSYLFEIVEYFMMIKNEYKYNWDIFQNNGNNINKENGEKYMDFKNISHHYEFQEFYDYMITNKVFSYDDAEWLEDAIHEILIE